MLITHDWYEYALIIQNVIDIVNGRIFDTDMWEQNQAKKEEKSNGVKFSF